MHLGHKVQQIDPVSKTVHFENGKTSQYEHLLTTMPITNLLQCLSVEDEYLKSIDTSEFLYSSAYILGFGIEGPQVEAYKDISWAYFPEKELPFYRVTWLHNYSDKVVPDISKHWSLLIEVNQNSVPKGATDQEILDMNEKAFRETGIIGPDCKIVSYFIRFLKLSYPVPFLKREEIIGKLVPYLEDKYQIYTRGRFGDWIYEFSN